MPRRLPSLAAVAILIVLVVVLLQRGRGGTTATTRACPGRSTAEVTRVVDGDTVEATIDGSEPKMSATSAWTRLNPSSPANRSSATRCAPAHFNERLVEGETVRLEYDAERTRSIRPSARLRLSRRHTFVNAELVRARVRDDADDPRRTHGSPTCSRALQARYAEERSRCSGAAARGRPSARRASRT